MLREKGSDEIRVDAIKTGIKKARSGCLDCMEGYFNLARQHGATEEEIQAALEAATGTAGKGFSRRELIKVAVASGIALSAAPLFAARAEASSAYFGTDSSTKACCGNPQNFYIGRLGYGTIPNTQYFNTSAASAAGADYTYEFWGLAGPGAAPGTNPFTWGQQQGQVAANQWAGSAYVYGTTVFADVEPNGGGWSSGNTGPNQQVLNGFMYSIFTYSPDNLWPGLYISPGNWRAFFGTGFSPQFQFALWLTGCDTCGGNQCNPCNCGSSRSDAQNELPGITGISLGYQHPVIWQYWISDCGCGDYNVSNQSGYLQFQNANSSTKYSSPTC